MDLRSGHPFWVIKNGLLGTYPPLSHDEVCEVTVIGGGITGALTAFMLVEAGVDVVLLDRRDVASGSTAASTSLLQHEIDTELFDLAERIGEADAVRCYRLGLEAVDEIERLVARVGDRCDFARRDSVYLASKRSHVGRIEREYELRKANGFDVTLLRSGDIEARFPFTAPAALLSRGDAEIDVFQLTHRLLQAAGTHGARICDRTSVNRVETTETGSVIHTDRQATVTARKVVFAAGYESHQFLKKDIGALKSTYALVSEPLEPFPQWPDRCLIWESARPYFYLRTTSDGRAIIGGEDTAFAEDHKRDGRIARKTKRLVKRFEQFFPGTRFEIAYAWAGTFGETADGLAYVGTHPEHPGSYFALGYGGNGITMSVTAAKIITDDYLSRPNPDARLFRFNR